MILSKIVEVIISAGAVQGFFLALILATNKNEKRNSNKILSALLIVLSVSIAHSLFLAGDFDSPYRIKEPFILLIGPLLLFYFRESTGLRPLHRSDVLHLIPFILFFLIIWPIWILGRSSAYSEFLFRNSIFLTIAMWTLGVVQYGFYWLTAVRLYRDHITAIESEFSNTEGKTLSWMKSFFHIFGVCFGLLAITIPVAIHLGDYSLVATITNCALSITIFTLGYEGLFQGEVFSNRTALQTIAAGESSTQNAADTQKVAEEAKKFVPDLLTYMEEKKPYLKEGLTLTELAKQVGMSRNQLSFVINNGIGDSFYTFINKYRVEEAKRIIADPKNANFTILSLAFEAGFPSKSSFHSIFKKFTGLTPTEYRNTIVQS
ncbi:MAG: helix-turn-helix transcriptional regulator [Ignavibacteriales bacterium]|nr:helix-turn-helix transcriptional regulator [Ignavibacteriales bacterium]